MNKSCFIKMLKEDYKLDFNELWEKTILNKSSKDVVRAFSDKTEKEFWEDYSQKYDKTLSLYDYAPCILDRILDIIGENKNIMEIGCGTGKFTIPMAKKSNRVVGVDFSKHMLEKTQEKLLLKEIKNVILKEGKFEDLDLYKSDSIFAVNANYRMLNIEFAINKMRRLAKEKVVLVWTMQRSIYDELLNNTHIKGIGRGQEYIHLINVLYNMGIDPCMEIVPVIKPIIIDDINFHYEKIDEICKDNGLNSAELKNTFDYSLFIKDNKLIYNCLLKVVIIYFDGLINDDFIE